MASTPPSIFAKPRRMAARSRLLGLQRTGDAARFVVSDMIEDVQERLAFVRHKPAKALVIGDWTGDLVGSLRAAGSEVTTADIVERGNTIALDLEQPFPIAGYDLIACLGLLDCVNDLPGALIHIRRALAPGGMAIASFTGAGSLSVLRQVMMVGDGERPAARIHPMVDVRAGAELLQRASWADPVVDSHRLNVRYSSLDRLVNDLREQGLGNVLADQPPPLTRSCMDRARAAFADHAEDDGRVTETFEIITLTGRAR